MDYNNLQIEKDQVTVVKIDRPRALNALNSDLLNEIEDAFKKLDKDEKVRVIILTGSGEKAFVAGADIGEMKDLDPAQAREFAQRGHNAFAQIEASTTPVIAAVNGFALGGGCELALSCDIRLASKNALFGQPETGLGIIPGFGGTQRLARIVGEARAKELIFTCDKIKADRAEEIGLVNYVYEQDQLLEEAREMAEKICRQAPLAVSTAKEAVNFGLAEGIEKGLAYETNAFAFCFSTGDQKKGMEGFINKEKVKFEGK